MADQWYYSRNGQRFGPVSAGQLKQLASASQLLPTDALWKEGLKDWVPASSVRGLFAAETPAKRVATADALDAEVTGRRVDTPAARAPAVPNLLDVPMAARHVAAGGADDLDREVTGRARPSEPVHAPPVVQVRAAAAGDLQGQWLDNLFVSKRLGEGGMGVVYKATDRDTGDEYAIKVLPPNLCADPQALMDLKKEVAVALALTHQNLLKIMGKPVTSGSVTYILMEYVDGENLEEYRRRKGGTISTEEFQRFAPQILAALDYLHEKGVVHLDVKPQNIMIARNGEVKITDYGIARTIKEQLRHGQANDAPAGTLAYMAPEQLRGGDVLDRRADVYAAALMFLRLLTEKFPFDLKDRQAVLDWHLNPKHQIHTTGVPGVDAVLRKALAVNPSDRFSSCREMLRALEKAAAPPPLAGELPATGQSIEARVAAARKKLQSLQARRVSGFLPWYREKFSWLFALSAGPFLLWSILLWWVYGFIWIPAWFVVSKLLRDRSMDASLDQAIEGTKQTLVALEHQELT